MYGWAGSATSARAPVWHTSKGRCTLGDWTCDRFQAERYVIGRNGVFATLYDC
ncbi:hypothetical protein ACFU6S_16890 [Streptomyces sp. NPDC057456]|uniref:hypothetical protein n=1 Tax=Streptomyces sp. NPDC057456 TaxID=3346139 RepID=UPI00369B2EF8